MGVLQLRTAHSLDRFVGRPTCRLVSRPKGVCAGRGGSSSASGNGDRFTDDQGDIGEYTDEGNRHVVRPRGEVGFVSREVLDNVVGALCVIALIPGVITILGLLPFHL
ncbi:hypothetical protein Tco_0294301 [Tanacetum coccineum]